MKQSIEIGIRILRAVEKKPRSTPQLFGLVRSVADAAGFEQALHALRDEGLITCTSGTWWRRGPAPRY